MGLAVLDWKYRCPAKVRFCHSAFVSFPAGAIFRIAGTASDWILERAIQAERPVLRGSLVA